MQFEQTQTPTDSLGTSAVITVITPQAPAVPDRGSMTFESLGGRDQMLQKVLRVVKDCEIEGIQLTGLITYHTGLRGESTVTRVRYDIPNDSRRNQLVAVNIVLKHHLPQVL